jgi:hypothetical protein
VYVVVLPSAAIVAVRPLASYVYVIVLPCVVDEVLGDLGVRAGGQLSGGVVAEADVGVASGVVDPGQQTARVVDVPGDSAGGVFLVTLLSASYA